MLLCPEDAEEACQDTLLNVSRRIDRFEGRSAFTSWLHAVAANSARSTYRRLRRRFAESAVAELPEHVDPRTTSVIAGSRLDLLDALEELEADHALLVEPVVLRDVSQLPYAEIAELLDLPVSTVKSRIHDARVRLRPLLSVHEE